MNKTIRVFALLIVAVSLTLCMSACTQMITTNDETQNTETTASTKPSVADGYDVIGGTWEVYGLYYNNRLVELSQNDALESMYDSVLLVIDEDGTFLLFDLSFYEGDYSRRADDRFTLNVNRSYRTEFSDGELKQIESETLSKRTFIISTTDDGMLRMAQMDPVTGQEKTDDIPMLLCRTSDE